MAEVDLSGVRVLHVVESLSAGVATALEGYVKNVPEIEHVICGFRRPGVQTGDELAAHAEILNLPAGKGRQLREVRRRIRSSLPDLVHTHSSWGGAFGRLQSGGTPTVHSPHCFPFERRDLSRPVRWAFECAERYFAMRTDVFAAVSHNEAALAASLAPDANVVFVPYSVSMSRHAQVRQQRTGRRVVASGRISAQKDPGFLVCVMDELRRGHPDVDLTVQWIGGGDPVMEARMRAAGIEVTGWLSRSASLDLVSSADLYLHTAAWEGFPLTVVETATLGVPTVVRSIPAFGGFPLPVVAASPREMADEIARFLTAAEGSPASELGPIADLFEPRRQADALRRAYAVALVGQQRPRVG